ncbi:hypothetical protein TgHK011_008231 [Trichoderma gracile]|nr:hypothetical protein TgHK011_008231 [Trichoderma gracile]
MGGRNRAFQKQRNGWNQSPRRGQNFGSPSLRNDVTFRGFTLEEEARQTSSHHEWSSTVQLRKRPVVFVSSGSHDPLQSLTPQDGEAKDASSTNGVTEEAAPEGETPREAPPNEAAPVGATSEEAPAETRPAESVSPEIQPAGPASEERKHVDSMFEEPTPIESTSKEPKPVIPTAEEPKHVGSRSEGKNPVDLTADRTSPMEAKNGEESDKEATSEPTTVQGTTSEKDKLEGVTPGGTGSEDLAQAEAAPQENTNDHPETDNTGSSDEVIIFKGRNAMKTKTQTPGITLTTIETEIKAVEKQISAAPDAAPNSYPSVLQRVVRMILTIYCGQEGNGAKHVGDEMFEGLGDDDEEDDNSEDGDGLPAATAGPKTVDEADDDTDDDDAIDPDVFDGLLDVSCPSELEDDDILEEHNGFDVMDWERPSVRRKKGKGGRLPFSTEGLDSDLEETLRTAYNNDRHKKAERKREREELRAKGLLGKRGQVDLRAKYSTGITMSQVIDEVKAFLAGSQETLSLPPMDPHTRKGVHELSHKLGIKSKSIGGGDQRRPVLYRTKNTSYYNEQEFEQVAVKIKRRFGRQPPFKADSRKNRQGQKGAKGPKGSKGPKPGGRPGGGAFDYHEGEVIGASAPELGTENRGRAMMEKMGWSTGTPLGASDNQGILHPVSQTMKKSRAGLGQE